MLENLDLILPAIAILLLLYTTLRCLYYLPTSLNTLRDTARRISSLDSPKIHLDFKLCTKASTSTIITIQQRFQGFHNTGLAVWGDSVTLAVYLLKPALLLSSANVQWSNSLTSLQSVVALLPSLQNNKWLELGCGTGVLAIALRTFGSTTVVATDGDVETLKLVQENVNSNASTKVGTASIVATIDGEEENNTYTSNQHLPNGISVQRCRWDNKEDHQKLGHHSYDVVVGSDLTYWPAPMDKLIVSITTLVTKGNDGTVIIAHKDRQHSKSTELSFFKDMTELFQEHACAYVMDQTAPGKTGGDVTEEPGMWLHVWKGLL